MTKKLPASLFFLFLISHCPLPVFPSPLQMFSPGDPVLEDLRFVVRESGKSFVSFTPPLSSDEVLLILQDVDADSLSAAGQEAYGRIQNALNPTPLLSFGYFSLDAHIKAAVEARARTNSAIAWTEKDREQPAVLSIPMSLFAADRLQLYFEPLFSQNPLFFDEEGAFFGANIPYSAERVNLNIPLRAFIATGGPWWNFELGRDRVSFGLGRTGNMAISDTPDYYDMARFSLFSSVFKYSFFASQMPLSTSGILAEGATQPRTDGNVIDITQTTQRYLYAHRLDVRLFRRVSLGLTEGLLVGNSAPELRFFNPLIIFHSFFSWRDYDGWGSSTERDSMSGSLFSVDLDWAIVPSLAFYGQFVMNEYSTPYELKNFPDEQAPNATGWLFGLEYTRDLAGWQTAFYGEFAYADPFLYTLSTPFASYVWMRRTADSLGPRYNWIGHSEGRDMMLFALGSDFVKKNLSLSAGVSFIRRGEHTILWDWKMGPESNGQKTPSGVAENKLTANIGSSWKVLPYLTLSAQVAGNFVFNAGHQNGRNEYGMDAVFAVVFFY
jgi:hypothetical protein